MLYYVYVDVEIVHQFWKFEPKHHNAISTGLIQGPRMMGFVATVKTPTRRAKHVKLVEIVYYCWLAPVSRVTTKKIREIKPLLDRWVPCNDVISWVDNGLERTYHASQVADIAPINEFLHHVIFQIGARITGSFPACSLHGEDDRTMAEGRVKANEGRKNMRQQFQIERERWRVGGRLPRYTKRRLGSEWLPQRSHTNDKAEWTACRISHTPWSG